LERRYCSRRKLNRQSEGLKIAAIDNHVNWNHSAERFILADVEELNVVHPQAFRRPNAVSSVFYSRLASSLFYDSLQYEPPRLEVRPQTVLDGAAFQVDRERVESFERRDTAR